MRTLYFDLIGGAAGDMLMAALFELGAPPSVVEGVIEALGLEGVELKTASKQSAGLKARSADVIIRGRLADREQAEGHAHEHHHHSHHHSYETHHHHSHEVHHHHSHEVHHHHSHEVHQHGHAHRPYVELVRRIEVAELPAAVKARALAVFERLGRAEAEAHGVPLSQVVLHEVGGDDALVDIVGVVALLDHLQVERVLASPPPLGQGLTVGAHGPIPLPAPATLSLLIGAPTRAVPLEGETVTPTGAALLMELCDDFGPLPSMRIEAVGLGAGHRDWPDRPNVVRAILGTAAAPAAEPASERVVETNLDDMSPEALPALLDALFAAGALDAWATPVHMKKGRPGLCVAALGSAEGEPALVQAFLTHSDTLGVRSYAVARHRAPRSVAQVDTPYGPVAVKRSERPDGSALFKPEHEDCARLAAAAKVSLRRVREAALFAAWSAERGLEEQVAEADGGDRPGQIGRQAGEDRVP